MVEYSPVFSRFYPRKARGRVLGSNCYIRARGPSPRHDPCRLPICERINSEFAFVKDRRRNRLSHDKANKLVGLFHNLRLLMRMRKVSYAEPAVAWTDDLERSAVTKYEPAVAKTSCLVPFT